jgi:hypothetical protein
MRGVNLSMRVLRNLRVHRSARAALLMLALAVDASAHGTGHEEKKPAGWTFNATILEASTGAPRCAHALEKSDGTSDLVGPPPPAALEPAVATCRYNRAFKVNRGRAGDVSLDGAKFWMAGARGERTGAREHLWAALVFDAEVSDAQRGAIMRILPQLYGVEWLSFTVALPGAVRWETTQDAASALLEGGVTAQIALRRDERQRTEPYAAAPRQDGFVAMHGRQAYRREAIAFEASDSAGLLVTVDISSSDVAE